MKILYCIAGMGFYGILERDILEQDKLFISARRVFSLEANPTQSIRSPRGDMMNFMIATYDDVMLNCAFIANMSEKAMFYQKILEIIEKEKTNEN